MVNRMTLNKAAIKVVKEISKMTGLTNSAVVARAISVYWNLLDLTKDNDAKIMIDNGGNSIEVRIK